MAHPPRPRFLAGLAACAALVTATLVTAGGLAGSASAAAPKDDPASPWTVVPTSNLAAPAQLLDVSSATATTAWAVGQSGSNPLLARLTRSGTTVKAAPTVFTQWTGAFQHVRAVSDTNVWASYSQSVGSDHLVHWDGRTWSGVGYPGDADPKTEILAIAGFPAHGPWLLVLVGDGHATLAHLSGSTWTQLAVPVAVRARTAGPAIAAITQDAAGTVWLAGVRSATADPPVLQAYKYVAGTARLVTGATGPDVLPSAVASGPDGLWAAGEHAGTGYSAYEHWSAGAWHESALDIADTPGLPAWQLYGPATIFTDPQGRPAWSGSLYAGIPNTEGPYHFWSVYQKYAGKGVWAAVPGPALAPGDAQDTISAITALPGTHDYLAVGTRIDDSSENFARVEFTDQP